MGRLFLSILVVAVGLAACGRSASGTEQNPVVLEIGEQRFYADHFRQFVQSRLDDLGDLASDNELLEQFLKDFADEQLLTIEAGRHRLEVQPAEVDEALRTLEQPKEELDPEILRRNVERVLIVQKLIRERIRPRLQVGIDEAREYFRKHASEFEQSDSVTVREILVENADEANRLKKALRSPESDFQSLAKTFSKGPSAGRGGEMGTYRRGELPLEFEKVVFRLRPGQVSEVVPSSFGYHLFYVEDFRRARSPRFEEVQELIVQRLLVDRERDAVRDELERLRAGVAIRTYPENARKVSG